jgi:hypothetical protein
MQTAEERQAQKRAYPQVRLSAQHVRGSTLLPSREDLLEALPKGGVAAEIGVASGNFTKEIVTRNAPTRLHLIDAWDSDRFRDGLRNVEKHFHEGIAAGVLEINQGLSTEVLSTFPDAYFDWVYIDTNHSYKTTKQELALCKDKVKANGRICGHDFTSGNVITPVPYGVIEACNEFCVIQNWRYEYLTLESHGYFSFCLARLFEDVPSRIGD